MTTGCDNIFMKQPKLTCEGVTECLWQYGDTVDSR